MSSEEIVSIPRSHSELIRMAQTLELPFSLEFSWGSSLKMTNHFHPWSLLEEEAGILFRNICNSNLRFGFEIATAFGISAVALGQAFKETGGKLVTMDAYVEEHFNHAQSYDLHTKLTKIDSDGYHMASKLIRALELDSHVILEVGWSPTNTPEILTRHFSDPLDFVMIDGGHTEDQVHADVEILIPFVGERCLLAFHDFYCVGEKTKSLLKDAGFENKRQFGTGFDLVIFSKGNISIHE